MRLYRYTLGGLDKFGVAADETDAYNQRATIDPTFDYLPVMIEEVQVEGYEITVVPFELKQGVKEPNHSVHGMNRDELKAWLTEHGITYTAQWGEDRLRELALQHV